MNAQIRPARPQEADALTRIALASKAYWGYPARWLEIWKPQLTFDPGYFADNESWVAEMDDVPCAFCTLLEKEEGAWIENLWVSPEYMGNGIGKRLFEHCVELSRQRNFKMLQLEADPNAVGFYQRMGMHKIGERQSAVDGQPRALPILELSL